MILTPGRTRHLRKGVFQGKSVLYWMLRDKRVNDNWALIEAQKIALENNVPLKVCFNINNNYITGAIPLQSSSYTTTTK